MRRLLPATLLVLTVPWLSLNCGDNDSNEDEGGGAAGRAQGGDAPSSGGRANSGGSVGEGGNGGEGNAPSSGGQSSSGGQTASGGEGGSLNSCAESTNCCELDDPTCEEGWESACTGDVGAWHYCCDAPSGVRRSCNFSGDIMTRIDEVCLDCDGKSFGIDACDCFEGLEECHVRTVPLLMVCDDEQGDTVCKNSEAGYTIDCSARPDRYVTCVCDPDAIVVTTE